MTKRKPKPQGPCAERPEGGRYYNPALTTRPIEYGWAEDDAGMLVQDEGEQAIIRRIWDMHRDGCSMTRITMQLNWDNVAPRGEFWYVRMVQSILQRPAPPEDCSALPIESTETS